MNIRICGTGSALPERKITNDDLSQIMDTSDEWISSRTGIKTRHLATEETTTSLAAEAAKKALADADMKPEEVELIIAATVTPDHLVPTLSCEVQREIGAVNAVAFDLGAACSGFLFALSTAQAYIASGRFKNALLIGAEVLSNPYHKMESPLGYVSMNGQEVYKFAVRTVPATITKVLEEADLEAEEISLFVLHQANLRIIEAVAKRLKQPMEKFPVNLTECGNISAASVPILLDNINRHGMIHRGDKVVLAGFGGGLTWGAAVLVW